MEIRSVAQFLEYWESFRGRTRRVIVVAHFGRLAAESGAVFAALPDAALKRKCQTPAGTPITTWKWLRAMGMLDVATPPLYGLTSEEVRARGARAS